MKNTTGQLNYECIVAHLYAKLGCVFLNEAPAIQEFKDYFEWYFWYSDRNIQLEINNLTEDEQRQLRIVSIIRKYSFLFLSLLWIDPNQILNLNPELQQFREQQKNPAYRYLNKDRQMFASLILNLFNATHLLLFQHLIKYLMLFKIKNIITYFQQILRQIEQ